MLCGVLNKSWKHHPTKEQLYGQLSPISKTIQVRQKRQSCHCRRSKEKLISNVFLWTLIQGCANKNLHQFCADTRCSLEYLLGAMNDREGVREIHAVSITCVCCVSFIMDIKYKDLFYCNCSVEIFSVILLSKCLYFSAIFWNF